MIHANKTFPFVVVGVSAFLCDAVVAQSRSDVSNVVFTPAEATLQKGGASRQFTATFNGTVSAADNGHIIFNITEEDGAFDDVLIDVNIDCMPALAAATNFEAEVEFKLKCLVDCELRGDGIVRIAIRDPTTQNFICASSPFTSNNHTSDAELDHKVVIEDVTDDQNHGSLILHCRESTGCASRGSTECPAVSEWGLMVMTLLTLTAGTIVFGRRNQLAAA